jgi:hypothetical protein
VKRRIVPVGVEGGLPEPGTPIRHGEREAGTMRSGRGGVGLALLRLDSLTARLTCGDAVLTPSVPAWMQLPAPVS